MISNSIDGIYFSRIPDLAIIVWMRLSFLAAAFSRLFFKHARSVGLRRFGRSARRINKQEQQPEAQ
jgi:hypothetical protein